MHRQRAWKSLLLEVLPSCEESMIGISGASGKSLLWATVRLLKDPTMPVMTDWRLRYRDRNGCVEGHRHYTADDLTPKPAAGLGLGHDGGLYNFGKRLGRE